MLYFKIIFLVTFFTVSLFGAITNGKNKDMPSIVPTDWLKDNITNSNMVIIDVRTEEKFQKDHIEGAVNMPALKKLFDKKFLIPELNILIDTFSKAGIDKNSLVVAYGDGSFIWSARLYWILEILGHNNVGILKIGYKNWKSSNLPISSQETKVIVTDFIPRVDSSKIQTKLSTLMAIGKKTIIDGRKKEHYSGKESLAKRFGHIPTAQNYACTQNYQVADSGNNMKNISLLKRLYKDVPKNKPVILYCDGGAEAALNYIVMQELGFDVSIYDGSWLEWGNDKSLPVTNPSKL